MRRKQILALILGAVIILAAIVLLLCRKPDIFNYSAESIKSIYITNGLNGEVVETPREEVQKIAESLKQVEVGRGEKADSTGWAYNIKLSDEKEEYSITLVSDLYLVVDNKRYEIKDQTGKEIYEMCKAYFS